MLSEKIAEFDRESCTICGICSADFPDCIVESEKDQTPQIRVWKCNGCGECVDVCRNKAISLVPRSEAVLTGFRGY